MTLTDQVHALLFVADSPSKPEQLATALNVTIGQIDQAVELLEEKLQREGPIQLVRVAGGIQLSTKPEYAEFLGAFLKPQRQRISKSLLEVLSIIAYRQPITTAEVEAIRGVNSDYSIRALVERNLIHELGRKPVPGRPVLYGTTPQFLHQFNLNSLDQLPVPNASPEEMPALPEPQAEP
jgi:segregation and condensation protein B